MSSLAKLLLLDPDDRDGQDETTTTAAVAPFFHRLGAPLRPLPTHGYRYPEEEEERRLIGGIAGVFEASHSIDLAGDAPIGAEELDGVHQGDEVRLGGRPARVARLSFDWGSRRVGAVLIVGGRQETVSRPLR